MSLFGSANATDFFPQCKTSLTYSVNGFGARRITYIVAVGTLGCTVAASVEL